MRGCKETRRARAGAHDGRCSAPNLSSSDGDYNRSSKREYGTSCQCQDDKNGFDVVAGLQCVIPVVKQFRDVAPENDQQNGD